MENLVARVNSRLEEDSLAPASGGLADPRLEMSSCSHGGPSFRDLLVREQRKNIGALFKQLIVPDQPPSDRRSWNKNVNIRDLVRLMRSVSPNNLSDEDLSSLIRTILTSNKEYNGPVQRRGDRSMCAVRLKVSEEHLVPTEFVELFRKANKISGDSQDLAQIGVSEECEEDTSPCNGANNFGELISHLKDCTVISNDSKSLSSKVCCSLDFQLGFFFKSSEYAAFKKSLYEDLYFVRELRKENRGSMSATRRLYSVYGNDGTGMLYSNFSRSAVDAVPDCLAILLHRLASYGYAVTSSTCIMVAVYPAMSDEDIKSAIQTKSVLFTAMDWHSDDNSYLGPVRDIEVWTISGFFLPTDPCDEVDLEGWKFLIRREAKDKESAFEWLPIPDNHILVQPKGMQATHQHCVQGHVSKYIRFVITIREVDKEVYQTQMRRRTVNCREDIGFTLRSWMSDEELRCSWTRPSKPQTHGKTKCRTPGAILSLLYPDASHQLFGLSKYLYDYSACFCWSCNTLVYLRVHDCQARNPIIFGVRHSLEIGKTYKKELLVEKAFNGALKMEESFRGDPDVGCTSIYLTKNYPGNDWSDWQSGVIYVGGAGGRKPWKKQKVSSNQTVTLYRHEKPQVSRKNQAVIQNLHYKLPVDIVVQNEDDTFMYLGQWYVSSAKLKSSSPSTTGFSHYRFKLLSRQVYWEKMARDQFEFSFATNAILISFLTSYINCHIVDDELNLEGVAASEMLAPGVDCHSLVAALVKNIVDLCRMFNLHDDETAVEERVNATLNRFKI